MHISITNKLIFDNNSALLFHNKKTNFEEIIEDKKELDFIKECIKKMINLEEHHYFKIKKWLRRNFSCKYRKERF